jgi:predicted nucleic acid-binding protein
VILVDTSIWIEFFRGREPFYSGVRVLLENRQAITIECVFAELLQGAKSLRERRLIREMWQSLPKVDEVGLLLHAGETAGVHKWPERGIGLVDAWIVSAARRAGAQIWTLDKKVRAILTTAESFSL